MQQPWHGRPSQRAAFTLLEVLLAMAIGIILMGAMYVAVSVQLRHAQASRDAVEQNTLVRALTARMTVDVSQSLGFTSSRAATQSGGQGGTYTGQTGASSSSSTAAASSGANASSSSSSGTTSGSIPVNLGVQGDSGRLILSVSQVPREFSLGQRADPGMASQVAISDLRRVSYWLVSDSGSVQGLARQEYKAVTSDDALNVLPPGIPDEASFVIAEEVKSLAFSYFDGNTWQDGWDGTTLGADGVTPIGPPVAIAVVLGLATPGLPDLKYFRHVIAVPTANNQNSSSNLSAPTPAGRNGP